MTANAMPASATANRPFRCQSWSHPSGMGWKNRMLRAARGQNQHLDLDEGEPSDRGALVEPDLDLDDARVLPRRRVGAERVLLLYLRPDALDDPADRGREDRARNLRALPD